MSRRAVHLADVAGVAHSLVRALNECSDWEATQVDLAPPPRSGGRLHHLAGYPTRIGSVVRTTQRVSAPPRPDVAHLHWARFAPFVRTDVPLVVHAHGSDVRGRRGPQSGLVTRALRNAALVIVSTPDLLEDVPTGAVYLPNPVDTAFFTPDDATLPDRAPSVFLFARLSDVKGADDLITIATLLRSRADVDVVAIGAGEHVARARDSGVRLVPPADRTGVRDLIRRSSVVVGQQRLGALGLAELEAMACGRAVIMPLKNGLHDDTPVVRASGPEAVADAVMSLLEDPIAARTHGERARTWVQQHHSFPAVAATLTHWYETVVR